MLGRFLLLVEKGGPTAAAGVTAGLKWVVNHAKLIAFPLESPLVAQFVKPVEGHLSKQKVPLSPDAYVHLLRMACCVARVRRLLSPRAGLVARLVRGGGLKINCRQLHVGWNPIADIFLVPNFIVADSSRALCFLALTQLSG